MYRKQFILPLSLRSVHNKGLLHLSKGLSDLKQNGSKNTRRRVLIDCTLGNKGRKFRDGFCLQFFQASWAKNYDLLRVIAVHGTMTIKFYVKF